MTQAEALNLLANEFPERTIMVSEGSARHWIDKPKPGRYSDDSTCRVSIQPGFGFLDISSASGKTLEECVTKLLAGRKNFDAQVQRIEGGHVSEAAALLASENK